MVRGNPLDYKISWSPEMLLSVLRGRSARFKHQGRLITVAPEMVFQFQPDEVVCLDGFMKPEFDSYPNGNAEHYVPLYGIDEVQTIIRNTLRYRGWNTILRDLHRLGWFSDRPAAEVIEASNAAQLDDATMKTLDWLGLRDETKTTLTAFDYFAEKFVSKPELTYCTGERDLVVLRNQVEAFDPDRGDNKVRITSTLTVVGDDDGYSAMQKTVGYTCAIAARLIADGEYQSAGVQIPIAPGLYQPVLDELAEFGIAFECIAEIL
jgi:alpha-aminoadipic semialdehyde synthase